MTCEGAGRGVALGVAIDAKVHVDFIDGHDAIHRLDRSVTALALDSGVDMRVMREANEVGQSVNAVPLDFERRVRVGGPWERDRLAFPPGHSTARSADTPGHCRHAPLRVSRRG